MRRIAVVVLAIGLAGCAKITLTTTCPDTSTGVGFALSGSTVGNTALSMLGAAAQGAKFAAKEGAAAPAGTSATMSYEYFPVFGADSGSLNCTQPPQSTVVVASPPASVIH